MIIKIYNNTNTPIVINTVTFTANDFTTIIDTTDLSSIVFATGLKLILESCNDIGVNISKGDFTYYDENGIKTTNEWYQMVAAWKILLVEKGINLYNDGKSNFYFNMLNNKLKIYNPVTELWFETELTLSEDQET